MVRRPSRGVTLVEVLMAIAIMALLTGLAAPSFVDSVARSRLEGTVATLANDLQYATQRFAASPLQRHAGHRQR